MITDNEIIHEALHDYAVRMTREALKLTLQHPDSKQAQSLAALKLNLCGRAKLLAQDFQQA